MRYARLAEGEVEALVVATFVFAAILTMKIPRRER